MIITHVNKKPTVIYILDGVKHSAVFWAENIFVYIEGISMDQATIDEVFNQALETLEIHQ